MPATVLEIIGIIAIVAGCYLVGGLGAALISAGALTVLVGYMRGEPT